MNEYTQVPSYFKPVTDEKFEETFLADRTKVSNWVGTVFNQNLFDDQLTMSHDKLTIWLGSWGMGLTDISSYKAWTFDDYADRVKWDRLVWRLFHVYPLGFLISRYKFYKLDNLGTWNPAVESLEQYSKGSNIKMLTSNRHINGAAIAQAMYLKIFGEIADFEDNASISLALYDVFSANPNIDNPLFVTLRRAFKKTLCVNAYPLPYFWNDFISHLFGSVPSEYREVAHLITIQDKNLNDFNLNEAAFQGKMHPQKIKKDDIQVVTDLVADDANNTTMDKLFQSIFTRLCARIASGEYGFNGKGAILHKIENHYFLVHPLWINRECENSPDESLQEQVITHALACENILLYTGHIDILNKSGFPVHLALINPELYKQLPENVLNAENNTDIRIVKKNSAEHKESSQ